MRPQLGGDLQENQIVVLFQSAVEKVFLSQRTVVKGASRRFLAWPDAVTSFAFTGLAFVDIERLQISTGTPFSSYLLFRVLLLTYVHGLVGIYPRLTKIARRYSREPTLYTSIAAPPSQDQGED